MEIQNQIILSNLQQFEVPFFCHPYPMKFIITWSLKQACLVTQMVKNPPAVQETWVHSLGWQDPLEMDMATHSSVLFGESRWTEEPGGLQSMGSQSRTQLRG